MKHCTLHNTKIPPAKREVTESDVIGYCSATQRDLKINSNSYHAASLCSAKAFGKLLNLIEQTKYKRQVAASTISIRIDKG